jgi:hypothetical protein
MGHPNIAIHEDANEVFHDAPHSQHLRAKGMGQAHYEDDDESMEGPYSEDSEHSEDEVDESVMEDMHKLEESFKGISQKYRLINRIGEGELLLLPRCCCSLIVFRHILNRIQSRTAPSTGRL